MTDPPTRADYANILRLGREVCEGEFSIEALFEKAVKWRRRALAAEAHLAEVLP